MDSAAYRHGIELFNRREFFVAHEVLEDVWRAAPAPEKKFLQGLIQIAVGMHHYSTGNRVGAQSLLARGHKNLAAYPKAYGGLNLAALRLAVARCGQALARGEAELSPPQLELLNGSAEDPSRAGGD